MLTAAEIGYRWREIRQRYAERDQNMADIKAIRAGNLHEVAPDMFSDDVPKAIIANHIDIAARDTAEMLAPLPAFNCSAATATSDAARKFADKKTKGVAHYLEVSSVQAQMYTAADYYVSFGLMPAILEPDFEAKVPRISFISPEGCYPEFDRWGRLVSLTRCIRKTCMELCSLYPDLTYQICGEYLNPNSNALLEVIMYHDKDQWRVLIPERENLQLNYMPNFLDEPCVVVAQRPGVTDVARGQYDDVIWIQLAKNRFSMMGMEAAERSVEAPIAVPMDVQEFSVGPGATIRTNSPEKVRVVGQEFSPAAFQESQLLSMELRTGARYPETRTGNMDASIVTGQGVRALEGGFNASIQAAQEIFRKTFKDIVRIALKMDEKLWGDHERDIRGQADGVPYSIRWKPSRDVNGDYTCDVTYGFAMGLDPNRALVALLQMRGDRLISRDFTRRQFPFGINVSEEETRIEVEELRSALLQSIAALAQTIPMLAQSGMDPSQVLGQLGEVIKRRQKGTALEDAVTAAFAPPEAPEGTAPQGSSSDPLAALLGGGPAGGGGGGLPPGVAEGQATMGPGGRPDIMAMLAGLNSGGAPTNTVNVKRSLPA
ncbi:hypothetical protein AB0C33_01930 [Nonomuraea sp. NPDC048881]|uniref:hypothetical protein n=1 Tax=Nonomuraea sp. NPDC048881 TaxID=3155030 RepID=UPI0033E15EB2